MDQRSPTKQKANPMQVLPGLLVHEIPDEEAGYDADVEILRPDCYEEPEAEKSEGAASSTESEERWRNELVKHMRLLSCNTDSKIHANAFDSSRGRKRRSKDAFGAPAVPPSTAPSQSQMEVIEVVDEPESRSRLKRARRRSRRSKTADGLFRKPPDSESEVGKNERSKEESRTPHDESVATESSLQEHLGDAMDLD